MKSNLSYNVCKYSFILFLKLINQLTPKKKNSLLFLPHQNCKNDSYDIINNSADNVLKLCDSILHDSKFTGSSISIIVYDNSKIPEYREYCKKTGYVGEVNFVSNDSRLDFFKAYCRASIIFTDNYYRNVWYKLKKQTVICLGYFVLPFKDDYIKVKGLGYKGEVKLRNQRNRLFDYHISTSNFCSRELSVDSLISLPKYKTIGFPRNDMLYESPVPFRRKLIDAIGFNPKVILAYIPTHRDYERKNSFLYNEKLVSRHSLFGNITDIEENSLNRFLKSEDIVIIAKAHPIQEQSILITDRNDRIVYFSDLIKKCNINLYEILAASDLLATDYSTVCFDYLLTDRPCLYYFHDYDAEYRSRTFFIDPIVPICAGDITYNIESFMNAIKLNIENPDRYANKRALVRDLIFYNKDGGSTKRVKNFVFDLIK